MNVDISLDSVVLEKGGTEEEERETESVTSFHLLVKNEDGENRRIELPDVRFLEVEGRSRAEPRGQDRAKLWKKVSEWLIELVISRHPKIKRHEWENRVKGEKWYMHREEEPDYYSWQEDEETLEGIRPKYSSIKNVLIETVGRPTRQDFKTLLPHEYDDPGLSERGRKAVRDLKAVFGSEILHVTG